MGTSIPLYQEPKAIQAASKIEFAVSKTIFYIHGLIDLPTSSRTGERSQKRRGTTKNDRLTTLAGKLPTVRVLIGRMTVRGCPASTYDSQTGRLAHPRGGTVFGVLAPAYMDAVHKHA